MQDSLLTILHTLREQNRSAESNFLYADFTLEWASPSSQTYFETQAPPPTAEVGHKSRHLLHSYAKKSYVLSSNKEPQFV